MKKILTVLILSLFAITAQAQHWHGYGYRGPVYVNNYNNANNWVAPALVGAVVGGMIVRSYYTQPPVVVYQQPPVYVQQPYPTGYHQESILDANCNCYRTVWVQN
jgi:hypothetical protein